MKARLVRTFALLLALGLTGAQVARLGRDLHGYVREREARDTVARLAATTVRFYRGLCPAPGAAFWRAVGREPLLDPWGEAYALEVPSPEFFLWRSAGPDRRAHSPDDLVKDQACGEDYIRRQSQPAQTSERPTSRDAK